MTVAYLKEKPTTPSTLSFASGMRSTAARLLGVGTGSRGVSRSASGSSRSSGSRRMVNYDGKGTYIISNSDDTLFISDLNSHDRDPVKAIRFINSNPVCHAFDSEAKDGHDLIVGLLSGDVCSMSLRQQLQGPGDKPTAVQYFINKDKEGTAGSQCTAVAWVPGHEGFFVVSKADGNLYVYDKSKDGNTDWTFPTVEDQSELMISHAKSSKNNPVARWHICKGAINAISFSSDGAYLATVGRDGYLRVFDFVKEQLIFGGKSYFGALLCCSWSMDNKYLLSGGEDDLVQVWSMDDRKMVAWGEGHKSWVSAVAFDPYWPPANCDETGENTIYRFGSVGQEGLASVDNGHALTTVQCFPHRDAQLLLWDLAMDELTMPLSRASSCSPTSSGGSPSTSWENACPSTGVLHPSPGMQDMQKLSPRAAKLEVDADPLSALEFTGESILTICCEGRITIWPRPVDGESSQHRHYPSELD